MWFFFALLVLLLWGAADLFYKKSAVENERYSHLKTAILVGFVMGLHAGVTLFFSYFSVGFDASFPFVTLTRTAFVYDFRNLLYYAPVSLMYAGSMIIGYFGLRYLELSVSSPIQNASGAASFLMLFGFIGVRSALQGGGFWSALIDESGSLSAFVVTLIAVAVICLGVFLLGLFEKRKETHYLSAHDKKYKIGFVAFFMPILYCIIDALGTALDGIYLDDFTTTPLVRVTEDSLETVANTSYELTFFLIAVVLFVYVVCIKKESFRPLKQRDRALAAVFETAGQMVYVYAMAANPLVAAPMIAAYCVVSVLLSRIFLKEKLTVAQYVSVALVVLGIIALGILEGLSESAA